MLKKIKLLLPTLALLGFGIFSMAVPVGVAAQPSVGYVAATGIQEACDGISQLNSGQSCKTTGDAKVNNTVKTLINLLSVVVGAVAVVFIIVAGFKYITSNGDANKVSAAKTALIAALVGLFVVAIAQALVYFVLSSGAKV